MRSGYSGLQIALHWVIAVLIVAAWLTHEGMGQALRARAESGATGITGNTPHVWLGGAVFALVLVRVIVRWRSGAPEPAPGPEWQRLAAVWGHRLLYALMLLVPALGAATWYGGLPTGEAHELAGQAIMIVALGHALAAIAHEAFRRDGTMARMFRPGR
jgi:cytochrome b561